MVKVTVWYEHAPGDENEAVMKMHPNGLADTIAGIFGDKDSFSVRKIHIDMPECGLTNEVLNDTDVLVWWGHVRHGDVPNEIAERVRLAVNCGMGFIGLHSAHESRPFRALMGTSCSLWWRDDEQERVWCVDPGHPIAEGVPPCFDLAREEMYGEFFDIPAPDSVVFIGWFRSGEVFRSGCCWTRGLGKVFYFQPGHETNPSFFDANVRRVLTNGAKWAAPVRRKSGIDCPTHDAVEKIAAEGRLNEMPAWYYTKN